MLKFDDSKQAQTEELKLKEAEDLAQLLSGKYHLPYIDLSKLPINTDALKIIPEEEARVAKLAAFKLKGKKVSLIITSPQNPQTQAVLKNLEEKGYQPEPHLGSVPSLERAWGRYPEISRSTRTEAGVIDLSDEEIEGYISQMESLGGFQKIFDSERAVAREQGGISSLLEIILAGAVVTHASDIHIEPQAKQVRLRYRLDGVLQDIVFFEPLLYRQLLARIKLISGLKLNVTASAQDGRLSIRLAEAEMEIRTSVLPGAYGESVVLRLLNPKSLELSLETLGIEPYLYQVVTREIEKPNGLVLLTGPTGSGKTTTLYSFLRRVSTSGNKIITIEDPIEYHLTGINQTQVNPGKNYTFLTGLRSALRQDPDIIMVGEIRDSETAKIAVNAALTGHLVFSTLHTNNAAGTIPRLIDLGVNPKVLDAALNIAIAQRLVRKLCQKCKVRHTPTTEESKLIEAVVVSIKKRRPELVLPPNRELWQAPEHSTCPACHQTGYSGRYGIFEAILMDAQIAPLLTTNPDEREIKVRAREQKILDMRQDGLIKVLQGITSLAELARVVDIKEEIL
jgi:type IV pilus assembly protein PilB